MHLRRLILVSLPVVLAAADLSAQLRCGTPKSTPTMIAARTPSDCGFTSTNPLARYAPTFLYRIPVVVHVLESTAGFGVVTDQQVREQIDILNEDFRALPGTLGANGFDTMIEFYLATDDPQGNPTIGITRTVNSNWYQDRGRYYDELAWDTTRYLNIYTNNASNFLGYVPDLPAAGRIVGTKRDRVVINWRTVGRDPVYGPPFDLGRTLTHEVGHYLGLFHPFEGGCGTSACYTTGDLICDTESQAQPLFGCASINSCGTPDPIDNYMNYTDDDCMMRFTSEQTRRMRCTREQWRPDLGSRCAVAAVGYRSFGLNVDSYTTSRPVLGALFTAVVDTATTGHDTAVILGYERADNLAVMSGYFLLVDPSSRPSVWFPPLTLTGPLAQFSFSIPNDPSLCGHVVFTQAVHAGGAPGLVLTNSQDLTFGMQ